MAVESLSSTWLRGYRERQGPDATGLARSLPEGSPLDVQRRLVRIQLRLPADLVRLLVPLVDDLLHGLLRGQLATEELRQRRVQGGLLVERRLRDAQVEHHVRALEAGLDGAQVVLGCLLAHACLLPGPEVIEVRGPVGVEA